MKIVKKHLGITFILLASFLLLALPAAAESPQGEVNEELAEIYDEYTAEQERAEALLLLEAATTEEERQAILDEHSDVLKSDVLEFGNQTTSQLVYYPLRPCRIVRTWTATRWGPNTPVPAGGTISIWTWGSRTDQGAVNPASCGVSSDAAAVVINIAAVPQSGGGGFTTVWPWGTSRPNAAVLNYHSGSTAPAISNAVVQPQCRGCANELSLYSLKQSHYAIDVLGYFARPTDTAVNNYTVRSQVNVANNAQFDLITPLCPANYRITGGGFTTSSYFLTSSISKPIHGTSPGLISGKNQADRWMCQGRNNTGGTRTVYCYGICAQIPGR